MTNQYGEVNWDSSNFGSKKRVDAKDLFLRLNDGENKLRVITQPHQYMQHRVKVNETDKYGQKVYCSMALGSCPACDAGNKAKPRWLIGVLSRDDGKTKILDMSFSVFDQICKLAKNSDWGDPTGYDINIQVDRNGGPNGYYSVQPSPQKPLTPEEQLLKDSFDLDEVQRRVTPPKPEAVQTRLDRLFENEVPATDNATENAASSATATATADDDDDEEFPSFDEAAAAV